MSASPLRVFAGEQALTHLREQGLRPADVRVILGASGGPKWFVLTHLDRYLAREWLPRLPHPVDLMGSSIGAWRMAAYANRNPVAAIDRLETGYLNQRYSDNADADEITAKVNEFVDQALGDAPMDDLHPQRHLHLITARCKGLTAARSSRTQALAFGSVALANAASRALLPRHFDRVVFSSEGRPAPVKAWDQFPTHAVTLTADNLRPALQASGAIPVIIHGVDTPPGAPPGVYRDGGMTDYHFDLPIQPDTGLVLYPHFSTTLKPGWFDKPLPWRKVQAQNYSHTVVLCPSEDFVARLPYGKIPDRKDFERLDDTTRLRYWQTVIDENERLAEAFDRLCQHGGWADVARPITEIAR
ncbi:MAG: patatin-like phospholipase family protein [Saccharospirillum sp.]